MIKKNIVVGSPPTTRSLEMETYPPHLQYWVDLRSPGVKKVCILIVEFLNVYTL